MRIEAYRHTSSRLPLRLFAIRAQISKPEKSPNKMLADLLGLSGTRSKATFSHVTGAGELLRFRGAVKCGRGGISARRATGDFVEVAGTDEALMLGRLITIALALELDLLQFCVRRH